MAEATYTYDQLAAWYTKHGNTERGRENVQQVVPNPAFDPSLPENPQINPKTIKVDAVKITAADGSTIVVQENPSADGSAQPTYTVHEHLDAPPTAASTGPARTADAEAQAAQDKREKEWNQANGGLYETHAARREREAKEAAAAKAGQGGGSIVERPDGTYIVKPDGSTIKTNLPASPKANSTTTVKGEDGKTYVVIVDAQGNVTTKDTGIGPAPTAPVPASATGWSADFSKPDLGLFERRRAVAAMLESGVFGDPHSAAAQIKANQVLEQDLAYANVAKSNVAGIQQGEETTYSGGITQRGQDISQADSRLQAADTIFTNAVSEIFKLAPMMKKGTDAYGAFEALLQKAYDFQEKLGGHNTPAAVEPGPYMSRTAPIFQPQPVQPPAMAPVTSQDGLPKAPSLAAAVAPAGGAYVAPPTGAPATAPPTQGPYAPPAQPPAPAAPAMAPAAPMSEQPRDTTGPGYPGTPGIVGPQPGDFPPPPVPTPPDGQEPTQSQMPTPEQLAAAQQNPLVQGLQQQQIQTPDNAMSWAFQLGFPQDVIARAFGVPMPGVAA